MEQFKLPEHWIYRDSSFHDGYSDDGRDYEKPSYIRKDGLARVYHNEVHTKSDKKYEYAISWEYSGDCTYSLENAIKIADAGVLEEIERNNASTPL